MTEKKPVRVRDTSSPRHLRPPGNRNPRVAKAQAQAAKSAPAFLADQPAGLEAYRRLQAKASKARGLAICLVVIFGLLCSPLILVVAWHLLGSQAFQALAWGALAAAAVAWLLRARTPAPVLFRAWLTFTLRRAGSRLTK